MQKEKYTDYKSHLDLVFEDQIPCIRGTNIDQPQGRQRMGAGDFWQQEEGSCFT